MARIPINIELCQTRKEYEAEIFKYYESEIIQNRFECRNKEWIENKIREIEETNKIHDKYIIEEKGGTKVLICKKGLYRKNKQIVPLEDYFDVIYTAHIFTSHGILDKIKDYMSNKSLYVPRKAITIFLKLCGPCRSAKFENWPNKYFYHAFIELIDLSDAPYGNDRFMLHYRALKLRRVFFRPLESRDVLEISEQLLEIFGCIGPPRVLHTPSKYFTREIIRKMTVIYPDSKIICGREMNFKKKSKQIRSKIRDWIAYNNTIDWSSVIYYLNGNHLLTKIKKIPTLHFGHSYTQRETLIKEQNKQQATKSSSKTNIATDGRFQCLEVLKPLSTYSKKTPNISYPSPVLNSSVSQGQTIYKTYTRKKNKNDQQIHLPKNNEERWEKKAFCVDTNLKEIAWKPTKEMKKNFGVWNSTLDLPDTQNVPNTVVQMNIFNKINFGTIPKENVSLGDDLNNKDEELDFPFEDNNTESEAPPDSNPSASQSDTNQNYTKIKKEKRKKPQVVKKKYFLRKKASHTDTDTREIVSKPSKAIKKRHVNSALDLPDTQNVSKKLKTVITKEDNNVLNKGNERLGFPLKDGMKTLDDDNIKKDSYLESDYGAPGSALKDEITVDVFEEKPIFEDKFDISILESKDIKGEPPVSELPIIFNSLENNAIKVDVPSFGEIVKIESLEEY